MNERAVNLAVVIAAYNEALNIEPLTKRLISVLDGSPTIRSWSLTYVVDGDDGTEQIVKSFTVQRKEIRLDYRPSPAGLGVAFRRGFQLVPVDAEWVVTMDADLNHQPEEIPRLLEAAISENADIVVGSRRSTESVIEGAPFGKTIVSRIVNRWMRSIAGSTVKDMTSGFRVYRAQVVREMNYRNDGFAFLPEILLAAASRGLRIVEEPIRFVFRKAGESKLDIPATSLSYISLLTRQSLRPLLPIALLLAAGVIVRMWFCLPEHRLAGDADGTLAGLCALDVQGGAHPLFFPGGTRLGPMSCYVSAGMFALFGPTRLALGATSVLFGAFFLVFMYLVLSKLAGRKAALVALPLLILPPLEFWWATYPTWGYIEIMAFSAATLWLGLCLLSESSGSAVQQDSLWLALMYGLAAGLSLWCSPQSLMVTGPMTLLLLLRRRLSFRSGAAALLGVATGVIPYLIMFLQGGSGALSARLSPVTGIHQVFSNLRYFTTVNVPTLLFSHSASGLFSSPKALAQTFLILVVTVAVVRTSFPASRGAIAKRSPIGVGWLLFFILLFSAVLFSVSSAGSFRFWTVRYVIPVYLVVPCIFSMLYARMNSRAVHLAVAASAVTLSLLNCIDYPFFDGLRQQQIDQLHRQLAALDWIQSQHCDAVIGDYFVVYSLNFDSHRRIRAVPIHESEDYFRFGTSLRNRDVRVALLERDPQRLRNWLGNAHLKADVVQFGDDLFGASIPGLVPGGELYDFGHDAVVTRNEFSSYEAPALAGAKLLDAGSDCYVDSINGAPSTVVSTSSSPLSHQSSLNVSGWAAVVRSGTPPDEVYVNLRSDKTSLFSRAQTLFARPDVAQGLHKPSLLKSGFALWGGPVPPDTYSLVVLQVTRNQAWQCGAVFKVVVH